MKIVVLHGAAPGRAGKDEEDTLVQADVVYRALSELGHEAAIVPISLETGDALAALRSLRPDIVFNLVESIAGKGSLIHVAPALLDALALPYTGAPAEAVFLTSNKLSAKRILQGQGIATPAWCAPDGVEAVSFNPGLYIIKPIWEHASSGLDDDAIIDAEHRRSLLREIAHRRQLLGIPCFAEIYIEGREFNISLLAAEGGPEILPHAEIIFDDFPPGRRRIVGYRAKWEEESFEYRHTPRRFSFPAEDEPLLQNLSRLARRCWFLFGLRGWGRIDFRVDHNGDPWVLEINTNPCLSPDAGFAAAAAQAGLTFPCVVERILHDTERG